MRGLRARGGRIGVKDEEVSMRFPDGFVFGSATANTRIISVDRSMTIGAALHRAAVAREDIVIEGGPFETPPCAGC